MTHFIESADIIKSKIRYRIIIFPAVVHIPLFWIIIVGKEAMDKKCREVWKVFDLLRLITDANKTLPGGNTMSLSLSHPVFYPCLQHREQNEGGTERKKGASIWSHKLPSAPSHVSILSAVCRPLCLFLVLVSTGWWVLLTWNKSSWGCH